MKNLVLFPIKKEGKIKEKVDAVLIGIDDLSSNFPYTYSIKELETLLASNPEMEFFVALNKNILNHELSLLEDTIEKIKKFRLKGILYYDISVLQIVKRKQVNIPLYWAQEHFTTNYLTAKYYSEEGVKGIFVSSDITKKEIDTIKKETEMKMIVPLFGYLPMFVSRRHLIQNYKNTFHIKEEDTIYYLEKDEKKYPVLEDKHGTYVFSTHILNAADIYLDLQKKEITYAFLNGIFIEEEIFTKIISLFNKIKGKNKEKTKKEIDNLCSHNTDTGFLFKETIYKIKK